MQEPDGTLFADPGDETVRAEDAVPLPDDEDFESLRPTARLTFHPVATAAAAPGTFGADLFTLNANQPPPAAAPVANAAAEPSGEPRGNAQPLEEPGQAAARDFVFGTGDETVFNNRDNEGFAAPDPFVAAASAVDDEDDESGERVYKVGVLGSNNVGKAACITRFNGGDFEGRYLWRAWCGAGIPYTHLGGLCSQPVATMTQSLRWTCRQRKE